jgi:hypothetical protein
VGGLTRAKPGGCTSLTYLKNSLLEREVAHVRYELCSVSRSLEAGDEDEGVDKVPGQDDVVVVAHLVHSHDGVLGRDSPIIKHYPQFKNPCFVNCVNSDLCN